MRRLSLIFLFLFTSGCATLTESTGKDIKEEPGKVIRLGTTTRADVVAAFGEPSKTTTDGETEELIYEFRKTQTPTYMGGLVIGEASKSTTIKTLIIVIHDEMVKSYRFEAKSE